MRGKRGGISFTTSAISTSGGRVKVILNMEVFIVFSLLNQLQTSHLLQNKEPSVINDGICLTTSVISTTGGSTKFISKIDVFIGFS